VRADFSSDPQLAPALFALLDQVFPGIAGGARAIRALGAAWEDASTPFVQWENDRILAHVGLIELPLVLAGRPVRAGSVHAVATDPTRRRQGLYGTLMAELLAYADTRYPTLVLTTEHPEYFTPFGFRHVEECAFLPPCPPRTPTGTLRRLDLANAADLARLHRLLETREPVSQVVGVGPEQAVFLFNEGRRPLWYCEELDCLLCLEVEGELLRLFDVVAPRLPDWEQLWPRLPGTCRQVELAFAPDRICPQAQAVPRLFEHDGPSWLMVRGDWAQEPFTLPRPART